MDPSAAAAGERATTQSVSPASAARPRVRRAEKGTAAAAASR